MKLSLAWIFDHIDADWKQINVSQLVDQFNRTTAEIEAFEKVVINLDQFSLGQVQEIKIDTIVLFSPEWKQTVELPIREDACEHCYFVLKKENKSINWAYAYDWHSSKDCLIPAIYCEQGLCAGGWKKQFETEDFIFEIDNKSITHRPDMWGHRGFAREIAALLKLPFKSLDTFLLQKPISHYDAIAPATEKHPFKIQVKDLSACKRFAGLYIEQIEQRPSLLWMAHRLLRVDGKPIDAIVDTTNYVMLDLSQPMHAFDVATISSKTIMPRFAANKEKLTLLDGQQLELTSQDFVITDGKKPIALAGIMGGLDTAITKKTKALFLEAACFDATIIRRSLIRHKIRTDASIRFEKSLDPNQNTLAIMRFLRLMHDAAMAIKPAQEIASVGASAKEITITVAHDFIEKRLGITIASDFIINTLQCLGFIVTFEQGEYIVIVPTFRCSKDITIKDDIVEEVGRFFGYTSIPPKLPVREMEPFSIESVMRLRSIKEILAYTLHMREVCSYAFFDESFLKKIKWEPQKTLTIQNPVSENWYRLVTSLIPGLLAAIDENCADYDQLHFFEWGRIWYPPDPEKELQQLAGIFFDQKHKVDFYEAKDQLMNLFALLKLPIRFERVKKPELPWFLPYQTAYIFHEDNRIGIAGKINQAFLEEITEGDAFIFELDGDFLLRYKPVIARFKQLTKFPPIERDISILVPLQKTADQLIALIAQIDPSVISVDLIDMFEKPEWGNQKALTFRFVLQSPSRTLSKEEADVVWNKIAKQLQSEGAQIR
ncbi:phenylalanine--tRNA ligase subunit beta [Candidatus Dependentiae bacterium]|nr:MAG: phenylalanine--tRNA ligase subunit beta [Candidatus Dependentiae bacterium]